jgi:dethiobiotin synthetase
MSGLPRALFITGTDTAVGKTFFARRLVRFLVGRKFRVGVFKPIETGLCESRVSDGETLMKAARSELPISWVSPYRFLSPAAPRIAATLERKSIRPALIERRFRQIADSHDWTVVEGAGGLMVPLLRRTDMADLIGFLELPVLLVSVYRLGMINQTLLSVHYAKSRGLNILGVILNRKPPFRPERFDRFDREIISEAAGCPVFHFNDRGTEKEKRRFWSQLTGI